MAGYCNAKVGPFVVSVCYVGGERMGAGVDGYLLWWKYVMWGKVGVDVDIVILR